MKTCAVTWFAWCKNVRIMSPLELQTLKKLESIEVQESQALQYIVTIAHDWLVKRVFVYIIVKRSYQHTHCGIYAGV